jgi:hypothetical protein
MNNLVERMLRAARLDVQLYEEVESDTRATGQAMQVVVLSSVAAGVGTIGGGGVAGLLVTTVCALIAWYVWALLTYWIGTRLLPEPQTRADVGELLRTTGFSSAPGIIRIAGVVPGLTKPMFVVAGLWMLVTMVVAVRQALDYRGTARAVGVCAIGWGIQAGLLVLLFSLFRLAD